MKIKDKKLLEGAQLHTFAICKTIETFLLVKKLNRWHTKRCNNATHSWLNNFCRITYLLILISLFFEIK